MTRISLRAAAAVVPRPDPTPGPLCGVAKARLSMSDDDRGYLDELIAGSDPDRYIARLLVAAGHDIGIQTVRRHRRGDCSCQRRAAA